MRVSTMQSGVARWLETHKPTRRFGRGLGHPALAVLLTVLWFAWLGWLTLEAYVGVPEVEVPVLVGKTLAEARGAARWSGLRLDPVEHKHDPSVPQGVLITQDQVPQKRVKFGRTIGVTVSLGPQLVKVPGITRQDIRDARLILEKAQLRTVVVNQDYAKAFTSGLIVAQTPSAGSVVVSDTPVALSVDPGRADEMPHLLGRELGEAYWLLKERNQAVSFIQTRPLKGVEPGLVVAQRPAGGTNIRKKAVAITLVISRPPLPGDFSRPRPRVEPNVPQ